MKKTNRNWYSDSPNLHENGLNFDNKSENSRSAFIQKHKLSSKREKEWMKSEDEKLFKYYELFGPDYVSISEMIPNRNSDSVKTHFLNTLRWAAYKYKKDIDRGINKLKNKFSNKEMLYLDDPIVANDCLLYRLAPVAKYLLDIKNELQLSEFDPKIWMKKEQSKLIETVGKIIPISIENNSTSYKKKWKTEESKRWNSNSRKDVILIEDEADEVSKSIKSLAARIWWRESNANEERKDDFDEEPLENLMVKNG